MAQTDIAAIKTALAGLLIKSRTHFTIAALRDQSPLPALLSEHPYNANDYTPIEIFFIVETIPGKAAETDAPQLAAAYAAAVQTLQPDWWSYPGVMHTTLAKHLLAVPGADQALCPLLANETPLQYLHGEANTQAKSLHWQRGDLAAGFIAVLHHQHFGPEAPLTARQEIRKSLASFCRTNAHE